MSSWSALPDHVLIRIFGHLVPSSIRDAYRAGLTCRAWFRAFVDPSNWRLMQFSFDSHEHLQQQENFAKKALECYGRHFRNVTIQVDQGDRENRRLCVQLLGSLGGVRRLKLIFVGTNPLFYGGQEFVDALMRLFQAPDHDHDHDHHDRLLLLEYVHLSQAPVMYTEDLFRALTRNHSRALRYLNIQTKQFICKIGPECTLELVRSCRRLIDLRVCHSSLSSPVLDAFADHDQGRDRLKHLSILCRRQEKYFHHDLSSAAWANLTGRCPELEVTLKFDSTCPLEKAREIMKPRVPVAHLFLEMADTRAHEVALAAEYYHGTLVKLVVQARASPVVEAALLDAVAWCDRMTELHVMCVLDKDLVLQILRRRPQLRRVTLKHELEPYPWVSDQVLDHLPEYV